MTDPIPLLDGRTVSRRLKLRAGTLEELVAAGKVTNHNGRYDVEEVRQVMAASSASSAFAQRSASTSELELTRTVTEDAQTRALSIATTLADKVTSREARMFELYADHVESSMKLLQDENKQLRAERATLLEENRKLHEQALEGMKAREEMLSKAHERNIITKMVEQKAETAREGLELLKRAAPIALKHLRASLEKNSTAKQLFESITPEQIAAILSIDFLSQHQKDLLTQLTTERDGAPPAPAPALTEGPSASAA